MHKQHDTYNVLRRSRKYLLIDFMKMLKLCIKKWRKKIFFEDTKLGIIW